ncbi:MAG: hypoxanthine phosphoribosyltransferase [Paludibacteraceae bacterium]|nr:hypoxanthine phosphoribosyltransferase [Paludibacteraceae bacterium]
MKRIIEVQGMTFEETLTPDMIADAVQRLAGEINRDFAGQEPLFICVLNGAFMFAADLFRKITLHTDITFVRLKSYTGTSSSGEVREIVNLYEDIRGRDVIVIEDIVDTGNSMHHFLQGLQEAGAKSAVVCSFLFKPDALQCPDAKPKYVGFEIPKQFIIGYGLDLDDFERNRDAVYTLKMKK